MTSPDRSISPRGIPPIRTDWLADVAWRLAEEGADRLRTFPAEHATLTDVVDGAPWRFSALRLSEPWEAKVELDADLYLPTDGAQATLRAGFAVAPWWDAEHGASLRVRVEIGPRGAVTFDPENWMMTVPLDGSAAQRPPLEGVEPGAWDLGPATPAAVPVVPDLAALAELAGATLRLDDLRGIVTAGDTPSTVMLPAVRVAPAKGLLGRLSRPKAAPAPVAVLRLDSDGPIAVHWTGEASLEETVAGGLHDIGVPELSDMAVTVRTPAGVLTVTAIALRVALTSGAPGA